MSILRLKEVLKEKGVSGKWLAEKAGITETSLSRIIKGDQQPRFELLLQISEVLDVDVRDLFNPTKETETETLYIKREEEFVPVGVLKKKY